MVKIAIITGASSGIGAEIAENLAFRHDVDGFEELWLVARRRENLEALSDKINKKIGFSLCRIVCGDVTEDGFCKEFSALLTDSKAEIMWLVNSAGCGFSGNFTDISWKNNCMCTELNCTAMVKIIGISLPYMKSGGRIVQLASAAAFFPQPGFAVYAATKAFVFNFSRALGRELASRKISVTTACPGPCDTEFLTLANGAKKMPLYKRAFIAKAPKVARKILNSAVKGRKLCLPGGIVKLLYVARKILPAEWIMFFQQNAR